MSRSRLLSACQERLPCGAPVLALLLAATVLPDGPVRAAEPEPLQPAVRTSSAALPAPAAAPATAKVPAAQAGAETAAGGSRAGSAPAHDRVELDTTQITGNRELPNVMYVVPWKRPELGEFSGRPLKSLLDELLAPVDRAVFERQSRYFSTLQREAAAPPGTSGRPAAAGGGGGDPAVVPGRNATDER